MNYLFDIGRPEKKKPAPEKPAPEKKPAPQEKSEPAIGFLSGGEKCQRCGADFFDVIEEAGESLLVQCAFCLTYDRVAGAGAQVSKDYVFSGGRFVGMTIAQVENTEVGISYLRWAAKSSPRPDEAAAAKMWVDQHCVDR
jgi:hypothetical protein